MTTSPWAFIAHKDGYWRGVTSADMPKRDLTRFLGGFAADGFSITAVGSRDEYLAVLRTLKPWPARGAKP